MSNSIAELETLREDAFEKYRKAYYGGQRDTVLARLNAILWNADRRLKLAKGEITEEQLDLI